MKAVFPRAAGAVLVLSLAGCMAPSPYVDQHLGEAATDLRHAQILNPSASQNMSTAQGMDAVAAKAGYDRYQKSFKTPDTNTNSFTIGVGR